MPIDFKDPATAKRFQTFADTYESPNKATLDAAYDTLTNTILDQYGPINAIAIVAMWSTIMATVGRPDSPIRPAFNAYISARDTSYINMLHEFTSRETYRTTMLSDEEA